MLHFFTKFLLLCSTMLLMPSQNKQYEDLVAELHATEFQMSTIKKLLALQQSTTPDNVNIRLHREDRYPLEYALFLGKNLKKISPTYEDIIQDLINKKANANLYIYSHPIKYAVMLNCYTLVERLIKGGGKVPKNILVDEHITFYNVDIIRLLIDHGADIDAQNISKKTLLEISTNQTIIDYLKHVKENPPSKPCWKSCWPWF